MLKGKMVGLRALEPSDLRQMQSWRNNSDFRRFYREYRELSMYDQESWYNKICCGNHNFFMFGIIFEHWQTKKLSIGPDLKQLLGVCGLTNVHWILRSAELSLYIGYDNLYCDNIYAPDVLSILLRYAFEDLNMHKIWAEVYDFDEKKIKLFENNGFQKDGIIRDNAFNNGTYRNSYIYSILESDYRKSTLSGFK